MLKAAPSAVQSQSQRCSFLMCFHENLFICEEIFWHIQIFFVFLRPIKIIGNPLNEEKKDEVMKIANPIYDVVFKFLMEDVRIARTILSALLKKDIVKVEVRPHEYANKQRDKISVFRIDFGATVREKDGTEHLVLIELQKTWLPTETLRFRQYLGVQYENPANIVDESNDQHALPMVAVYLLGHRVGDIEEPVLYVHHQPFDYNGQLVTKGVPDPFVESLTHDSIIVQIPLLRGQVNNRLEEVLSVFDQSYKDTEDHRLLTINDSQYPEEDIEMQRILKRLLMAAADTEMRMEMNVENEYYSIIENQDTDILLKDREIAEKTVLIQQKDEQLSQKDEQLSQKDEQLHKSIEMLVKAGLSKEEISKTLNIDISKL